MSSDAFKKIKEIIKTPENKNFCGANISQKSFIGVDLKNCIFSLDQYSTNANFAGATNFYQTSFFHNGKFVVGLIIDPTSGFIVVNKNISLSNPKLSTLFKKSSFNNADNIIHAKNLIYKIPGLYLMSGYKNPKNSIKSNHQNVYG